jgi:hypothetical protein
MVSVDGKMERSFVAEMLSKSDSPHRLLESLSSALSASGNTAYADQIHATERKPDASYVSCIFYNGKPLLPPRLSESDRTEMARLRDRAILVEQRVAQRKADAMRRLLGYVDQRLKQIECRKATKPGLAGNRDERNQASGHCLTDKTNYAEPGVREMDNLHESRPPSFKTSPISVSTENLQSVIDTNETMTSQAKDPSMTSPFVTSKQPVTPNSVISREETMTSLLDYPSMTSHLTSQQFVAPSNVTRNLPAHVDTKETMTSHLSSTQTLPVSNNTVSYQLSYVNPGQARVSPRRRLDLDGSTDRQYERVVFAPTSSLVTPFIPHNAKLYAIARGYLTRKLYRSKKVRQLAATIRDLSAFLTHSSPVSKSKHTHDAVLVDQVKSQVSGTLFLL